jgi:hypothetical protein
VSSSPTAKKLAVVGAGSAGLITLYYAIRRLPDWQIVCFEKSGDVQGSWGHPYPGFVSTSTKYATQFSCYRRFDATADPEGERRRRDFFRDGEYGAYLKSFVRDKGLAPYIRHESEVRHIERVGRRWRLTLRRPAVSEEDFDALVLCTGLTERPKEIRCGVEQLLALDAARPVEGKKIVVVGGGESATDVADRLASAPLGNEVWLSIDSGIRVSPRYHPIKGVPSDFLRTRLLLSIHEDIRNAVGQKFVEARIRYREVFERVFRRRKARGPGASSVRDRRKHWDLKLTERAKDSLFKMFHNKSDDFLDTVAEDRLRIVGPPLDESYRTYADFEDGHAVDVHPDLLVPRIGFTSNLAALTDGAAAVSDFHLGCVHVEHPDLFLVGFARPILGNVPSISEMQAQYVTGLLGGRYRRPPDLREAHRRDRERLTRTFPELDTDGMYPVEMFPYCDRLAKRMGIYPSLRKAGSLRSWLKIWLSPASTMHYLDENYDADFLAEQPIHAPAIITVLLLLIKLGDLPYSLLAEAKARSGSAAAR